MKVNLATTETISSSFVGDEAGRFISASLLSADSIENGAVDVITGFKYKWHVPNVNLSSIVANATCDFTPAGTLTIADRTLTTEDFEVNLQLCKKTYHPVWKSISVRGMFTGSFTDYLIGLVGANVAASREVVIWSGATASAGHFNGLEVTLALDAALPTGQEVGGTTVTASNVVVEIAKVLDAAPSGLYSSDGFAIRIPTAIARHYIQAQAALGAADLYNERKAQMTFLGVPLIVCPGMTDDVMVATKGDNFFYGLSDYSDSAEINVLDMKDLDGSDNVRISMKWSDGVQYGNITDCITYGITNSAND